MSDAIESISDFFGDAVGAITSVGGGGGAPQMRSASGGSLPGATEAYAVDVMPIDQSGATIESFNYDVNSRMAGGNKG